MKIVIQNARVLDPYSGEDAIRPLYIKDQLISEAFPVEEADRVVDGSGLVLCPGLIDSHAHLRDPGYEYKEDIVSGTRSAAAGGFTAVTAMPNTAPACDNKVVVRYMIDKADKHGFAEVLPVGAATKNLEGKELSEFGIMKEAGIVALSDDGKCVDSADMMQKILVYAAHFDIPVMEHCQEATWGRDGVMNESYLSTQMGLRGIPSASEDIVVARDVIIAEYHKLPIHITHISTKGSVDIIRAAQARGVKVTADTCPHFFTLTEEAVKGFNTNAKMYPPLRGEEDRVAITEGLVDGTITMISTDHAPHDLDSKDCEFSLAANGIIGFETAFSLSYTYLVKTGKMSLMDVIKCFTEAPASLFKLKNRSLAVGSEASVALFDLQSEYVVDPEKMHSRSKNTPFGGFKLNGQCRYTIWRGKVTHEA